MFDFMKDDRFIGVWWALAWRGLLAMLVSMFGGALLGGILGFVVGLTLGSYGVSPAIIKSVCAVIGGIAGFMLGLFISLFPLKFVLGKDLGGYKLEIVSINE